MNSSLVIDRIRSGIHADSADCTKSGVRLSGVFQKASVLVPIVESTDGLFIPLMRRTKEGGPHSGQISFPGGRREAKDRDAVETALRETREEYGWNSDGVTVLGCLEDEYTLTGYVVRPVVAHLQRALEYDPDPAEVEEIFHLPVDFLIDPENEREMEPVSYEGRIFKIYEYHYQGVRIWGLTARILNKIARMVRTPVEPTPVKQENKT